MQIKTIELTGEEIKVELERPYIFVEINNKNDSEILASINPNIVRGNDNVLIIKANSTGTLGDVGFPKIKEIYLSGSGKIEIIAKDFVTSTVNIYAKGGGISPTPPSPDVLKFLPYPEDFIAYYDQDNGLSSNKWENMLGGDPIVSLDGFSFVKDGSGVYLPNSSNNKNAAQLIKGTKKSPLVIYTICRFNSYGNASRSIFQGDTPSDDNEYLKDMCFYGNTTSASFTVDTSFTSRKVQMPSISSPVDYTNGFTAAIIFNENQICLTFNNELETANSNVIINNLYLCSNARFKAILISTNSVDLEHIKENVAALKEKYNADF